MNDCIGSRREPESEELGDAALAGKDRDLAWLGCPLKTADIDEIVSEIFQSMLGAACTPNAYKAPIRERISATIRLSGDRAGSCAVEMPAEAGDWLTDSLMGSEADWDDEMIQDAVGELCNMVTGGLKRRLGAWLGECRISLPEVHRSPPLRMEPLAGAAMQRSYSVGSGTLTVSLAFHCKSYLTTD
ncbi:MAG: hypothetical protein NVSMB62_21790 [Acidobacteriaceae bacterium]